VFRKELTATIKVQLHRSGLARRNRPLPHAVLTKRQFRRRSQAVMRKCEQPGRRLVKLSGVTTCGYGCPALTMCGLTVTKNVQVFLLIWPNPQPGQVSILIVHSVS
jgi:hypothetical protein